MAEVYVAGDLAGLEIDDDHVGAVGACCGYSGVAVDGHVGGVAVGRDGDLVASDTALGDGAELAAGCGVDDADGGVALVGDDQMAGRADRCVCRGLCRGGKAEECEGEKQRAEELNFHLASNTTAEADAGDRAVPLAADFGAGVDFLPAGFFVLPLSAFFDIES